jgi:tetratricopeptide (TPR) repeat protein
MNRRTFFAAASTLLFIAFANSARAEPSASPTPSASDLQAAIDLAREPIFDGLGSLHHSVTTKTNSTLAQRFFDQGLTFVYAFNHDEAAGSFEEAAHLDPDMAMAYWGIALSLGPNINLPEDNDRGKMAYAAMVKAKTLEGNVSAAERKYIDALAQRYAPDGRMNDALQLAYANAMREVAHQNPDDADAGALFAESMMDLHPWGLWTLDGKPVDGTPEIVATLEGVMAKFPDHLGANHYYIHAVEASPDPGRALPSAERLPKLAPAAGHIVHMPAHIYFRTGDYDASAAANEAAIKADKVYLRERNPKGVYPMMYVPHNIQFLWARFSNWDAILKEPAPPADLTFTTGVWHYARGLALAAKNRPDDALAQKKKVDAIIVAIPADRIVGFNTADKLLAMGSATLAGEIESAKGQHDEAINYLKEAVAIQDALNYEEPPPWYYPVRETLGMELLAAGKTADAEQVFRDDLKQNPENGWSLNGLALCLHARNASDEAASVDARLKKAWAHADVKLPAAVPAAATVSR